MVDRYSYLTSVAKGRNVVHLGCANAPYTATSLSDGTLLHDRLTEVAISNVGVDADANSLDLMRRAGRSQLLLSSGPLAEIIDQIPPSDIVIAGEIIEHVDDAGNFLKGICALLRRDSAELVLTTVNAYGGLRLVQYAWPRRGPLSEPVHPDHVAYYSLATLRLACERAGLEVVEEAFYNLGNEHRGGLPRRHRWTNDVLVRWLPQLADGIIVRCRVAQQVA